MGCGSSAQRDLILAQHALTGQGRAFEADHERHAELKRQEAHLRRLSELTTNPVSTARGAAAAVPRTFRVRDGGAVDTSGRIVATHETYGHTRPGIWWTLRGQEPFAGEVKERVL